MDVSVSVSLFQDELASTIEHAVKAALYTVLCAITKAVGSKFTELQVEMAGKEKKNECLKLRLEISESELKAVRGCINAADADIKQPLIFQDPIESHAIPESEAQEGPKKEAVYTQEESFEQECCASLMHVTELTFVKDEEVPQQECVPIKEEFVEQECVPIAEELPHENHVCTLEENNKLGSNLCDDSPSECELGFRDPIESHAIPESEAQAGPKIEAVYTQEESFEQQCCASLMQVTELAFVKDEEVPQQECVPIKEEFIEQECVLIAEELPYQSHVCTLEENNKLGSNLCDDSPSECELGFRASKVDEGEHDSTLSPQCKNSSRGKPQCKKHRETTPQEEMISPPPFPLCADARSLLEDSEELGDDDYQASKRELEAEDSGDSDAELDSDGLKGERELVDSEVVLTQSMVVKKDALSKRYYRMDSEVVLTQSMVVKKDALSKRYYRSKCVSLWSWLLVWVNCMDCRLQTGVPTAAGDASTIEKQQHPGITVLEFT
ncbi:UNVERIFIED_CONTAM: hypothetical protein FKN15_008530 [Acipenser sinensis]